MDVKSLGTASGNLLLVALAVLAVGILRSTFGGPCSESGAYTSMAGVGIAALACVALLVRSIRLRSGEAWVQFGCSVVATIVFAFVASLWTVLMCRGV